MKNRTIKRDKPALAEAPVAQLTPNPDPPLERYVRTVTMSVGDRRYEMSWHSEFREITKGPAQVIEMPGPAASRR